MKEKSNLVSDEKELATIFINITKDLKLKKDSKGKLNNLEDVPKAFEFRPSIEKINKSINTTEKFWFFPCKRCCSAKVYVDGPKATPVGDIPIVIVKKAIDIHLTLMSIIYPLTITVTLMISRLLKSSGFLKRRMT